jgi:hypothetical protein
MPNKTVEDLLARVGQLERQVAVLLSWHKVQVSLLGILITGVLAILVRK